METQFVSYAKNLSNERNVDNELKSWNKTEKSITLKDQINGSNKFTFFVLLRWRKSEVRRLDPTRDRDCTTNYSKNIDSTTNANNTGEKDAGGPRQRRRLLRLRLPDE